MITSALNIPRCVLMLLLCSGFSSTCLALIQPQIFPEPREMKSRSDRFSLDPSVRLVLPREPSAADLFLAQSLVSELGDKHRISLTTQRTATLPASGRFILMGSNSNPLVQEYMGRRGVKAVVNAREGYFLEVDANTVVIAGADDAGAFYGLQSLLQLIEVQGTRWFFRGISLRDWPDKPFRGIKLYLPGHQNIAYFKRFIRNVMALYKFNQMILEVDAAMRLERHPELNAGWMDLGEDLNFTRRDRSWGPGRQLQDSANADVADSEVLEKSEVAELVAYARENHIEVIPEIPSLTHSYYLLARHRELAEIADAEWPDTYCPSNPDTYNLLFDVLDEYIDVVRPQMVHVGHDEWRMPWGVCALCKGKDPRELFAQDINRIHDYLNKKGIKMAIWGDHLIEPLRGKRTQKVSNPQGTPYEVPGALSPEQVKSLIPRDLLIFNWFWDDRQPGEGEANDVALQEWGFQQVYGNMQPDIQNYSRRAARDGVVGGAPSSWAATNELNFGKDLMFDFLGCAQLLWSGREVPQDQLSETVQSLLPQVRRNLSAKSFPSDSDSVVPVSIQASLNSGSLPGLSLGALREGRIVAGRKVFELGRQGDRRVIAVRTDGSESPRVRLGKDVSSVIFLHAAGTPANNIPAYEGTWNYADTADLLGWYEVTYEDGFTQDVPLRYGVNILEAGWGKNHVARNLAYQADLVDCGEPNRGRLTFFAYEWTNPRPGVRVGEIRLKGSSQFKNVVGRPTPQNTILLAGISVVKARIPPEPKPHRATE